MTKITFIEPNGTRREIEAADGQSVMLAATGAGIDGISAECGGSCICATCHCLVIDAPQDLPEMEDTERDTLEFTSDAMQDNSRLTCQVEVTPALDGAVFQVVGH
ncbi:2Fe-2S iron-sulfur cluster-binding protein [Thalassovita mangrovi]|uniref:2Fe-2S iron-sulfur cluster binding domain-containing protein n=1 Tax=Thalassovita mangrovi TaxID=2692236 RepID=A0A6L8LNH8_9RHOB|nr:2Fe-2S iron-sulfur cluster-binding protein [Thalassovita mangrovi]MYM57548.1 2Fe-2S iron-sulfur cluster binding domain-containing protein [Thalassovita mangrovi]